MNRTQHEDEKPNNYCHTKKYSTKSFGTVSFHFESDSVLFHTNIEQMSILLTLQLQSKRRRKWNGRVVGFNAKRKAAFIYNLFSQKEERELATDLCTPIIKQLQDGRFYCECYMQVQKIFDEYGNTISTIDLDICFDFLELQNGDILLQERSGKYVFNRKTQKRTLLCKGLAGIQQQKFYQLSDGRIILILPTSWLVLDTKYNIIDTFNQKVTSIFEIPSNGTVIVRSGSTYFWVNLTDRTQEKFVPKIFFSTMIQLQNKLIVSGYSSSLTILTSIDGEARHILDTVDANFVAEVDENVIGYKVKNGICTFNVITGELKTYLMHESIQCFIFD